MRISLNNASLRYLASVILLLGQVIQNGLSNGLVESMLQNPIVTTICLYIIAIILDCVLCILLLNFLYLTSEEKAVLASMCLLVMFSEKKGLEYCLSHTQ